MKSTLLICGYVREQESKSALFQVIPDAIANLIYQFYPNFMCFTKYKHHDHFSVSQNGVTIQGKDNNECRRFVIYPEMLDQGYSKGVHIWSVSKDSHNHSIHRYHPHQQLIFGVGIKKIINKNDTEKKLNDDETDEIKYSYLKTDDLILNNTRDIEWDEDNKKKYKLTKSQIFYTKHDWRYRGIQLPFDADQQLKRFSVKFSNLQKYCNRSLYRASDAEIEQIVDLQQKCLFLWIRYWCLTYIERNQAMPMFVRQEEYYQIYFKHLMNEYMHKKIDEDNILEYYKNKLMNVVFCSSLGIDWLDYEYSKPVSFIAMVLDCNKWRLSFYIGHSQRRTKVVRIPKGCYCFALEACSSTETKITVLDEPCLKL